MKPELIFVWFATSTLHCGPRRDNGIGEKCENLEEHKVEDASKVSIQEKIHHHRSDKQRKESFSREHFSKVTTNTTSNEKRTSLALQKLEKHEEKEGESTNSVTTTDEHKEILKSIKQNSRKKKICKPSKYISFIGINAENKIEIVSLEPKEDKCTLPPFPKKLSKDFALSDLDNAIFLYDGQVGIHKLENNGSWVHVTNLTRKLSQQASLTFSDGSWWMTGGLEGRQRPSIKTVFFDKLTGLAVNGRPLNQPQAGHCIVEVGKSFVSAGGTDLNGFTQLYNITKGLEWEVTKPMIVPRKHHACVSITSLKGEKLLAVGGLDKHNQPIRQVELFDPITKAWNIDERRSLPYLIKKPSIVTIGCKVYLISNNEHGFGAIYILTETNWKLLNYQSKFSKDMINGAFTSSALHCSDFY